MKTGLTALLVCLALGLVAAGCGGNEDGTSTAASTAAAAATTTTEPPRDEGDGEHADKPKRKTKKRKEPARIAPDVSVAIRDNTFSPSQVTIPKGGTVTWTNEGDARHDVTRVSGPGLPFKSGKAGSLRPRARWYTTFDVRGKITYECTVHAGMRGTVIVR